MITTDRFETQVYYVETMDLFHTIDYRAKPTTKDWVVVRRLDAREVVIEPFRGQPFIGVARALTFCQLDQSEQWNPLPIQVYPD